MIADPLKDENRAVAKREAQAEQFKRDMDSALPRKELAWKAIQRGADPAYIASRYGFTVEQMVAAKNEHERRENLKRERTQSKNGDSELPEVGEVVDRT